MSNPYLIVPVVAIIPNLADISSQTFSYYSILLPINSDHGRQRSSNCNLVSVIYDNKHTDTQEAQRNPKHYHIIYIVSKGVLADLWPLSSRQLLSNFACA
ncbi:hypothetical protein FKM82_018991 [Ascaphus truei]